jgi:nitrate/TMAO reductase-like tetraheme cytochrome c subunit
MNTLFGQSVFASVAFSTVFAIFTVSQAETAGKATGELSPTTLTLPQSLSDLSGKVPAFKIGSSSEKAAPRTRLADNKGDRLPMPYTTANATVNSNESAKSGRLPMPVDEAAASDWATASEDVKPAEAKKLAAPAQSAPPATVAKDDSNAVAETSEQFSADLLSDEAPDQKDELLYPTKEELLAIRGRIEQAEKARKKSDETAGEDAKTADGGKAQSTGSAALDHVNLFIEDKYPSANTCGVCHPKHYMEWSTSQHAYAQISPIYLSLSNKINQLANGSNGDFCLRCHSPVGANLGESQFMSNLDRHPTSREGITCVVCHRIDRAYNKASGRLALVEGGVTDAVFGPKGNAGVKATLAQPEKFRVVTDPKEPGRKLHAEAKLFNPITTSTFCGSCHDVTLFNGFRLEEAFSEYRLSPAAARGTSCHDCHMGKIQGKESGYDHGPAAIVGDQQTKPRKLTSHLFSGPDYPIVHPGIFPHNQEAAAFKTQREWLQFDHKAGWGTDEFEKNVPAGTKFPKPWESVDDRYDARIIINKQFELLKFARQKRLEVLRNGFGIGEIVTENASASGISFKVKVQNLTDGHNVPTGFTGERLVWLEVTVKDRDAKVVFKSGDRDPNGDVRDSHSSYVHAGEVKIDPYLFSLQSIFVVQNGRGGELSQVIPIPYPSFALPRVLPAAASLVFTGEPPTERNHKKGINPNGYRWAPYRVERGALTGKGPYKATVVLRAQAVPINLIAAIQDVGFDYKMTPREVGDALIAGSEALWTKEVIFNVHGRQKNATRQGAADRG